MMHVNKTDPELIELDSRRAAIGCLILSMLWVTFLWGFWSSGVYALGINAAIVFLMMAFFLKQFTALKRIDWKAGSYWITPILLSLLSFALYENPFLKSASLIVLPMCTAAFCALAVSEPIERFHWEAREVFAALVRYSFAPLTGLIASITAHIATCFPKSEINFRIIKRVITGAVILLLISVFLIIPMLSSADEEFGRRMSLISRTVIDFVCNDFFIRVVAMLILSVIFFAQSEALAARPVRVVTNRATDSIIAGMVLGGVLALYLVFLSIQFECLWWSDLPREFKATENLVKSGFWQLIGLSTINLILFAWSFQRTNKAIQLLLGGFTTASLLLVASAAQRMYLYATLYGLSYEKFFASYAVLYCIIIFSVLLYALVVGKEFDAIKGSLVLFIWMYAIASLLPTERIVLNTNVALSHRANSRINLDDLTMLSADVFGTVINLRETRAELTSNRWNGWVEREQEYLTKKPLHEHTLSSVIAYWFS